MGQSIVLGFLLLASAMTWTIEVRNNGQSIFDLILFLGTNNSFQTVSESPLSKLYSSSILERHHLNQALVILNMKGNTILRELSTYQYSQVLSVIEEAILATDLSLHFKHLNKLLSLSEEGPAGLDWEDEGRKSTLLSALMTASDLGASTKPWSYQKKVI